MTKKKVRIEESPKRPMNLRVNEALNRSASVTGLEKEKGGLTFTTFGRDSSNRSKRQPGPDLEIIQELVHSKSLQKTHMPLINPLEKLPQIQMARIKESQISKMIKQIRKL